MKFPKHTSENEHGKGLDKKVEQIMEQDEAFTDLIQCAGRLKDIPIDFPTDTNQVIDILFQKSSAEWYESSGSLTWTDDKLLIRCYGTDTDDTTRYTMSQLTQERISELIALLSESERIEAPQKFMDYTLKQPSLIFDYWKKIDISLDDAIPQSASEWHTLGNMRWRHEYPTPLDFKDPDDCQRGVDLLTSLEEDVNQRISSDVLSLLRFAKSWLRGNYKQHFDLPVEFKSGGGYFCEILE